jgi:hypothetical protein
LQCGKDASGVGQLPAMLDVPAQAERPQQEEPPVTDSASLLSAALERAQGAREALEQQAAEYEARAKQHARMVYLWEIVVAGAAALQGGFRENFEQAVGAVVSKGLGDIWPGLQLVVEMTEHGVNPIVKFSLRHAHGLETDVADSGGGRLVVAAFLVELLVHLSARPPLMRFLALDEVFKDVSVEYVPALIELLKRLAEEGNFQFLLSTHRQDLMEAGDAVYRFDLKDDGGDGETAVRLRTWEPSDGASAAEG